MSLYKLSFLVFICIFAYCTFTISLCEAANSNALVQQDATAQARAFFERHSPGLRCDSDPITNYPRWEGFPVQNCFYTDLGITTKAYMLNPSADRLAKWTVTACQDAKATSLDRCIRYIENAIVEASSGGIFPVAGYIVEPNNATGGTGTDPQCLLFRDGVTIATFNWDTQAPVNGQCGPANENNNPVKQAKRFARVASTTRQDYYLAGGKEEVGTDKTRDVRWLDVVRKLYQEAWTSNRNQLLSAKAKAGKARGEFQ